MFKGRSATSVSTPSGLDCGRLRCAPRSSSEIRRFRAAIIWNCTSAALRSRRHALFGPGHFLPAWYPRELLGDAVFRQPSELPLDPDPSDSSAGAQSRIQFEVGVLLAAWLAALFTYMFCRRAGLSEVASVTAGWTFASAGFFASRVFAGHLPLLEAYPSLPLLLWLADRATSADRAKYRARDLGGAGRRGRVFRSGGTPADSRLLARGRCPLYRISPWCARSYISDRRTGAGRGGDAGGLVADVAADPAQHAHAPSRSAGE